MASKTYNKDYYSANKARILAQNNLYAKKRYLELLKTRPKYALVKNLRSGAKKRGLEFNITEEDLVLPDTCPIFGTKLNFGKDRTSYTKASVDRVDNTKGYVKGNVRIISWIANTRKGSMSIEHVENLLLYMRGLL